MLCLTRLAIHACVLPVLPYASSSVKCFMSIGAGFGNQKLRRSFMRREAVRVRKAVV